MAEFSRSARKQMDKFPENLRSQAMVTIERIERQEIVGKKLKPPLEGIYSARLGRSYRILYRIKGGAIQVIAVTHRRDAYQ